jgi:hypothetical protein
MSSIVAIRSMSPSFTRLTLDSKPGFIGFDELSSRGIRLDLLRLDRC